MYCKRCGSKLKDNTLGCPVCGQPIDEDIYTDLDDDDSFELGEHHTTDDFNFGESFGEHHATDDDLNIDDPLDDEDFELEEVPPETEESEQVSESDELEESKEQEEPEAEEQQEENKNKLNSENLAKLSVLNKDDQKLEENKAHAQESHEAQEAEKVDGVQQAQENMASSFKAQEEIKQNPQVEIEQAKVIKPYEEIKPAEVTGRIPKITNPQMPSYEQTQQILRINDPRQQTLLSAHRGLFFTLIALIFIAILATSAALYIFKDQVEQASIPNYTITYETNGGSRIPSQEVKDGTIVNAPPEPTISGRYFAGWYSDASCQTQIKFPLTITENMTLYAKWARDQKSAQQSLEKANSNENSANGNSTTNSSSNNNSSNNSAGSSNNNSVNNSTSN